MVGAIAIATTSAAELNEQLQRATPDVIWARAVEVFGNKVKAKSWMLTPRSVFNGRTPQQVADSGSLAEQRAVLEALIAIDYGLFS